ncbi:kinase-like domain, phloem protein 2-like protein [Tanacetum coccineum]
MFSPDDFAHLKIPLEHILIATNNFDEKNLRGEGAFEKDYKGQLLWHGELIEIEARRLKKKWFDGERQFWMVIFILSTLKHKNLVSLVGFCDENDEKVIVTRRAKRGSLANYLSDPMMLTWVRRLHISVGAAHALSYIHYDEPRDFSVIHRDIDCYGVLLNDDWEPMLAGFYGSIKIRASERHLSFHTDKVYNNSGYTDPTYIQTKNVSHKSDMYSFGILLFELLCGRKSISEHPDNKYLTPMAIFHYREKTLDEIIDPVLWKQMDPQSFNVFAQTAYDCLNEERSQRPDIDEVVTRLENALKLQMEHQNAHQQPTILLKKISSEDIRLEHSKGRLLHSKLDIVAKRLYFERIKDESRKFWTEISILSSLEHKNLVSLIGFHDTDTSKIIVYKKEANESLEKYLNDQTLTWMQRLKICVGVAKALSYIHYNAGRDFSVIHCNIRCSKILLDDEWEPKLSGFELSLKNTVARRLLLTRDICLDWVNKSTGKSSLDGMVDPHLRKQMDPESFRIFSEITYYCLQEERAKRPYIDQVVKRLDKALELQWKHENPELPKNAVEGTSSNHLKWKDLEHLKIGLNHIELATKSVSHKSDMYSFGILLFELLCGRKSIQEHPDNKYLTPMAIFHYREKLLDDIIDVG